MKINKGTIKLENMPRVISFAAAAGKKEGAGPIGECFDIVGDDALFGQTSFEKAESELQKLSFSAALDKANLKNNDVDMIFAGDLLNQCIGSTFAFRESGIPYIGVYGACSTMALTLCLSAMAINCGAAEIAAAVTSSHFCSAERQYRFPLNYGCQRPQTAQWTVTGSGAVILGKSGNIGIDKIHFGSLTDYGIYDANNMGAAMAPAAAESLENFFNNTNTSPNDYDAIFTGDLGYTGSALLYEILKKDDIDISAVHNDCGMMIFNRERQDVHSGGSGCGCSASVLSGYILKKLEKGEYKNIIFCATGAMLSPASVQQGESIPCIAHIVNFVRV